VNDARHHLAILIVSRNIRKHQFYCAPRAPVLESAQ